MKVTPIAAALGADVSDLDLAMPLDAVTRAALLDAWHQHQVLRFRGQALSPEDLIAFSRHFGELERHDNYQGEMRHPDHAELLVVKATEVKGERVVFGQQWHSDLSYTLRPAKGSALYCLVLPPVGGDTLFASMQAAYDALSPALQRILERLHVVHDLGHGRSHRHKTPEQKAEVRRRNPPVSQPMVRVHPATGRKSLFVSEWMCCRIVGMSEEEGQGLLDFLFRHSTQPEYQFRQSWQVGDVLLWDNRSTVHMALADYPTGAARELIRTSIVGEASGVPWLPAEGAPAHAAAPTATTPREEALT
jgi:taurine dioxygenase